MEHAVKPGVAPVPLEPAGNASSHVAPHVAPHAEQRTVAQYEDASRYCPVCSQRLESRRCKLVCAVCGYYMSCADYY